ncbi:MAG: hypothetical protein RMY28_033550 [Nostoc sp. ChiSLP01]|nr:hypothetical protein [Nostoc sp. CmiSLP01]MDZ8287691.1 hypothetical protein [Nostoc sp. ChiSLP01]
MNPFFNGLVRGLTGQAGQVVAGVIVAGIMGAFGIDNEQDLQADSQDNSQDNSDFINDETDV